MNHNGSTIIREFTSSKNYNTLHAILSQHFRDPTVDSFLRQHLKRIVINFSEIMVLEINNSDLLSGITLQDELALYNNQFLNNTVKYIIAHVAGEVTPMYAVSDNYATSTRQQYARDANDVLASWKRNPTYVPGLREDTAGDTGTCKRNTRANIHTGITFCDQSDLNTSNHVDQYENNSNKLALNAMTRPHEHTVFGVATPASDKRLLSRSIFRREGGVVNGIPLYERRLYNRHYERDIDETLHNDERGYIQRKHDMQSLYDRVDYKNQAYTQGVRRLGFDTHCKYQ